METNDFMDLNTTELFDDSNDSFDKDQRGSKCESNISEINIKTKFSTDNEYNANTEDDLISADTGMSSTDLIIGSKMTTAKSIGVEPAVVSEYPASVFKIVQKSIKGPTIPDTIAMSRPRVTENAPLHFSLRPTTVLSKLIKEMSTNDMPTVMPTVMPISNDSSVSIRSQSRPQQKMTSVLCKGQINSAPKYTKVHAALASSMTDSPTFNASTAKIVKLATSNTPISTTNAISDVKTSPLIFVQEPAPTMGQSFTSFKILQKCSTPGSVKQKILNINEMKKLNSSGSLKPLLLNATATSNVISSPETKSPSLTSLGYVQSTPSLIVFKPSTTTTATSTNVTPTTLQIKPQQLYQPNVSSNTTKSATISFVSTPNIGMSSKQASISIGTKLIPSRILTSVKTNPNDASIIAQHPLPAGLTKIPKDTVVKQIPTKDAKNIDFKKILKSSEKSIEPTITTGQKPIADKPLVYMPTPIFFSSNDKSKGLLGNLTKHNEHQTNLNFQMSNGKLMEVNEEIKYEEEAESVTISNGRGSNPNGSIKTINVTDFERATSVESESHISKNVEKLKTSPRILGRSKSLTISKDPSKKGRQRYASSGTNIPMITTIEKLKKNVNAQIFEKTNQNCSSPKCDLIEEIEVGSSKRSVQTDLTIKKLPNKSRNSLECDEKIDDSDKSKSVSPDVGEAGSIRKIPKVSSLITTIDLTSYVEKNKDPLTYIKWRNGIGSLKYSNIQFRKNEFNLLETIEVKEFHKSQSKNKSSLMGREIIEQINLEKKADNGDKSSAISRKKLEAKPRYKRGGMNLLQNIFVWELYLRLIDAQAAPDNLFINPFPSSPNLFEVGMKLEAIDPEHNSFFCVCTVVETLGYRIRLAFDGYDGMYSFWRNADSMDIFPPGWCAKNGRPLQPPLKYGKEPFDWHRYITQTNGTFAPRSNFTHLNSVTSRNPFKVGMKLEADHIKLGRGKVGVATVGDVLDNRILIQFDGFEAIYDYWTDITSPNIHPYNWHKTNKCRLIAPKEFEKNFSWPHYITAMLSKPVPTEFFCPRPPIGFREGMKMEIVDKKVPILIRPCTVIKVDDFRIQVLFDGWPSTYSYWIEDDHPDIHPINWCLKTEHPLEPPLNFGQEEFTSACGVLGCREVGNAKHFGVGFHYTIFECPYESRNWLSIDVKPNRLYESRPLKVLRKRKARAIMTETEVYQSIKSEPPSEENSLSIAPKLTEWDVTPTVKNEKMEIDEAMLQPPTISTFTPEHSPTRLPKDMKMTETDHSPTKVPKHIKVTETILHDYGPGLMKLHKLWTENSKSVNIRRIPTNPNCWTVDEVVDYVSRLPNCSKLGKLFHDNEIDGDAFLKLCQNDLIDVMALRMGPAVKIYNQIVALRSDVCERFMELE